MPISDYNIRAELQTIETSEGESGELVQLRQSNGFIWIRLRRRPFGGFRPGVAEFADNGESAAAETFYRSDIAEGMYLIAEDESYRINAAFDPDGKRIFLRLELRRES